MHEISNGRCSCCGAEASQEIREAGERLGLVPICMHEHSEDQKELGQLLDRHREMLILAESLVGRAERREGRRSEYASALTTLAGMVVATDECLGNLQFAVEGTEEVDTDQLQSEVEEFVKALLDQGQRLDWETLRNKLVRFSVRTDLLLDDLDWSALWDGAPVC